jgi:hypothetical protein
MNHQELLDGSTAQASPRPTPRAPHDHRPVVDFHWGWALVWAVVGAALWSLIIVTVRALAS